MEWVLYNKNILEYVNWHCALHYTWTIRVYILFSSTASKSHIRIHPLHAHKFLTDLILVGLTCESYYLEISCFVKAEEWLHGVEMHSDAKQGASRPPPLFCGYSSHWPMGTYNVRVSLRENEKSRVYIPTFKVLRTLCSIVGRSHCFFYIQQSPKFDLE